MTQIYLVAKYGMSQDALWKQHLGRGVQFSGGPEQHLRSYYGWKGCGLDTFPFFFFHLDATFLLYTALLSWRLYPAPAPLLHPCYVLQGKGNSERNQKNVSSTTICKFHHYLPVWLWMMYFIAHNSVPLSVEQEKINCFLRFDSRFK